jgi:hypothetical protein
MNWRPWIIAALFLAMLVANLTLVVTERVLPPELEEGLVDRRQDDLATTPFTDTTRLANLRAFGLPEEMAVAANRRIETMFNDNRRLKELLRVSAEDVQQALCWAGGEDIPQRYAAVSILIEQEDAGGGNMERRLIDWERTTHIQIQDWYATSLVPQVYRMNELGPVDEPESTVIGLAAILSGREQDLLDQNAPFNRGFSAVLRAEPRVEEVLVEYIALMHLLTELANADDGICN